MIYMTFYLEKAFHKQEENNNKKRCMIVTSLIENNKTYEK